MSKEKDDIIQTDVFAKDYKSELEDFTIKMVAGALKGVEYPVHSPTVSFGRSKEADIHIKDTLISRVHCRLTYEDGNWFLEDLNSTNGTWMIGQKVEKKVVLPLRTSVRVGKSVFEIINSKISDLQQDDTDDFLSKTISYRIQPETLVGTPVEKEKKKEVLKVPKKEKDEESQLAAIYKFQNIIASALDEKDLYSEILNAVINIIAVDQVYLLLYDLENGGFQPKAAQSRAGLKNDINLDNISSGIVSFVKENREAVLSVLPAPESDSDGKTKSVMCIPLLGKQQINGMLYLKLDSATKQYDEDDLRLMTVVGHTSGMALEHSKIMEFNLKNERLVATGTTAAGLSHYIKNILAGLDGSLNLLRMGIDEKDFSLADESWNILNKNHRRLGNLVLDLLNLASEQDPSFEICDINTLIKDVIELLQTQLEQEGIKLVFDSAGDDIPLYAEVDSKGIHRVLLNLVTNAEHAVLANQKYLSDKNVGNILIKSSMNESKDYIIVTVSDNGIGVEKEEILKMFDLFVTSKGSAGTGLGLAVCKRIIETHSGSITASGERGKGCTIAFSLPVAHNETNTTTISIKKIF